MGVFEIITKSAEETKKIATNLAQDLKKCPFGTSPEGRQLLLKHAFIIALEGNLGSGKTTYIQGLAMGLGIEENVLSPTFVILKEFSIAVSGFKKFYHIDAYRLKNSQELIELGFKDLIKNSENIIVIEWADRIKRLLPKKVIWVTFKNFKGNKRKIQIFNL